MRHHPRVVDIKGIEIEAEFAPHMLYITNDDKPGFIGRLGTLLGVSKANIATFHLGRDAPDGSVIALVQRFRGLCDELSLELCTECSCTLVRTPDERQAVCRHCKAG